jgi:hypothetical protein
MNKSSILFFLVCLSLFYASCEDPSSIGSGLLDDDKLSVEVENKFDIEGVTLSGKPVITLIQNFSNYTSYPIGSYADETFGKVESELFTRIVFNNSVLLPSNMHKATFDSIVLVMSYDTTSMYGDLNEVHNLTIKEIFDVPVLKDSVFSNTPINNSGAIVIGRKALLPRPKDSLTIVDYFADTISTRIRAQIRVPIDKNWFKQKFEGIKAIETNLALQSLFNGVSISSDSKNSLLGLNFGAVADNSNSINGINVFYRDSADVKRNYKFLFSASKYTNFKSEPSPSLATNLNSPQKGQELLFVQGLDGVNTQLTFKDITKLKGKIISHASLELTVADIPSLDNVKYPYIPQLSIVYDTDNTTFLIRDISDLLNQQIPLDFGFGGNPIERAGTKGVYKMNVTKLVKSMALGTIPNTIRLLVSSTNQRPHRTPFYGVKHPTNPVKLVVSYTTQE